MTLFISTIFVLSHCGIGSEDKLSYLNHADSVSYVAPSPPPGSEVKQVPHQTEEVVSTVETPALPAVEPKDEETVPLFKSKGFLWGGIIIILVEMVWFSVSLFKEKPSEGSTP